MLNVGLIIKGLMKIRINLPMRSVVFCVFILSIMCSSLKAQSFSALQNSNYSGVNGIYTNPASVTLMTHKRSANIGGFGFEFSNDYLKLDAPFSLWDLMNGNVDAQYKDQNGDLKWDQNWVTTDPNKSLINLNLNSEFRGPAYVNQYGRFVWGTATRTRSQIDISNTSVGLWQFARQWLDSQKLVNPLELSSLNLSARANSYQEISAILGYRLVNNSTFKLGFGTTLKGILGLGSVNVQNTAMRFKAIGMDTIQMSDGYMEIAYTDNNLLGQLLSGVIAGSLPSLSNIKGLGFGMDIGISMEIGSNMSTEMNAREGFKDYRFKFGAAILDIGSVGYRNQNKGYIINTTTAPFNLALNNLQFIQAATEGTKGILDYVISNAKDQGILESNNQITRIELPSTLQLQADIKVLKGVFVAAHWQQALLLGNKWEFSQTNSLAVVPRFEHKWFEFALPLRYRNNFNRWSFGAHLRTGPLFIGSDNMANIFQVAPYSGMTFYMGITTLIK